MLKRFRHRLQRDFLTGALILIPFATTLWVVFSLMRWLASIVTKVPSRLNPLIGMPEWLVGLINFLIGLSVGVGAIILTGAMVRNLVGRRLLGWGERLIGSIPVARSIYKTLKQIVETLAASKETKFRRVVMLQYPRIGVWSLGFVTGEGRGEIQERTRETVLNVFIPTTPNPTSGWYIVVPESEVVNLTMSVEEAFKLIISGGIVAPETSPAARVDLAGRNEASR